LGNRFFDASQCASRLLGRIDIINLIASGGLHDDH
jgi:hypothetical protein